MDVWQILLYGFGVFLALRILLTLMERHRLQHLQKLVEEHQKTVFEQRKAQKTAGSKPAKPSAENDDSSKTAA